MFEPAKASANSRSAVICALLMLLLTLGATPCHAVLFYDTGNAGHNTAAPTEPAFENSGWQYEGKYGAFLATIIAPQYIITAQHFGDQGPTFVHSGIFNGGADVTYNIDYSANGGTGFWNIPNTDLRILKVQEIFPYYAPLYTGGSEVGLTLVTHGMGGPRSTTEVLVGGVLHGWEHNLGDGTPRWGTNTVSGIYPTALGDLLTASFSAGGTTHEATLSGGDSGGGVFVNDGGIWKLAGINYSVDGQFYIDDDDDTPIDAGLFDRGGLYQGSDGFGWTYIPDTAVDDPSSFYASRISSNAAAIMAITAVPEPHSAFLVMLAAGGFIFQRRRRHLSPQA